MCSHCLSSYLALACALCVKVACASFLAGSVRLWEFDERRIERVDVALFQLDLTAEKGLTKRRLLGAESVQRHGGPPTEFVVTALPSHTGNGRAWVFTFNDLPAGNFSVVAFEPSGAPKGNWLDFAPPRRQAMGFHRDDDGCGSADPNELVCSKVIEVSAQSNFTDIDITLRAAHLMPEGGQVPHGSLRRLPGAAAAVLHVHGTAYERGFAQGLLLAQQIVDFFDFVVLEDMVRSKAFYSTRFLPSLRKLARLTTQFRRGIEGLLAGMRSSKYSLQTSLGRDIDFFDIVAMHVYGQSSVWTQTDKSCSARAEEACTQYVFWGDAVAKDIAGGTIAGRNMDQENDVRKVTVNDLVIHAVEPTEKDLQRYVHVMWPGFLGTASGFNEQGRYLMQNAGCNPPGPAEKRSPIMPDVIANLLMDKTIMPAASPERIEEAILEYQSEAGGTCTNGCILVTAEPFDANCTRRAPGFIYEGDRFGGAIRLPQAVPPVAEQGIMATNHFLNYKAAAGHPEHCNGIATSFSSLARYFAGQNKVESWMRTSQLQVGSEEMKELLRVVAHGTSEHSIIFKPNQMTFEIAVASPNGVWDAPYSTWTEVSFESLFTKGLTDAGFDAKVVYF